MTYILAPILLRRKLRRGDVKQSSRVRDVVEPIVHTNRRCFHSVTAARFCSVVIPHTRKPSTEFWPSDHSPSEWRDLSLTFGEPMVVTDLLFPV